MDIVKRKIYNEFRISTFLILLYERVEIIWGKWEISFNQSFIQFLLFIALPLHRSRIKHEEWLHMSVYISINLGKIKKLNCQWMNLNSVNALDSMCAPPWLSFLSEYIQIWNYVENIIKPEFWLQKRTHFLVI